ncbi:tRNA 2'-phosphotransferase 1-like [Dendronephthya gigantea]|uniref:tRNA 2'-phosphotransferase 1-like n=1 Tax=Dendronephthya gigantea TaxID=151771 RepID=UPI00106D1A06|nr:tRNA 2'-phosphotransferase 1-like [Dendronephthya gigantea]
MAYSVKKRARQRGGTRDPDNDFSRKLTYVLRHNAVDLGMNVNHEGYVNILELQAHKLFHQFRPVTAEKLQNIIDMDEKQRFSMVQRSDSWFIRANQGHSGNVAAQLVDEKMLTPVSSSKDYPICVHGTDKEAWAKISASGGLSRMARKHTHMSSRHKGSREMISGMRKRSNVMIYIDLDNAISAGIKFYISTNQVILSEGNDQGMIPIEFFKEVKFLD